MSWKDARRVVDSSVSVDTDFAGTDPPTAPPAADRIRIPREIAGQKVVGVECYLWLKNGATVVGRATLVPDVAIVDIDDNQPEMPVESAAVSVPGYTRLAFDATPGDRDLFFRIDAVAGAAAGAFTDWGIRYRELF